MEMLADRVIGCINPAARAAGFSTATVRERSGLNEHGRRARASPRLLDARSRAIVEHVASDVCEYRGWHLLAANARSNRVHFVVAAGCAPEDVALSLKSWITRRLVEVGTLPPNTPLWSRHASTVYLWTCALAIAPCTT